MSVIIQDLTKIYGQQKAIDRISFEAKPKEILGFLGPNGAGKTTTMKIITCFIPATEGKASVCGFDTETDSMEVRRRIGYLPEHNPLYKDLYVREYLQFVAGVYKLGAKSKARIAEVIELTGLGKEQHKPIMALSKGYRQRVGLAQAILHDPEVLILDEPMSGLDPNQAAEIRRLIQELGQEKTLIFSSHDMAEVQTLCDRVVIIRDGQLVANDKVEVLRQRVAGSTALSFELLESPKLEVFKKIKGVKEVRQLDAPNRFQLICPLDSDLRPELFRFIVANNWTLIELRRELFSVEDVFQTLTRN